MLDAGHCYICSHVTWSVYLYVYSLGRQVSHAKTGRAVVWGQTWVSRRHHLLDGGLYWRHLSRMRLNAAAMRADAMITVSTCYYLRLLSSGTASQSGDDGATAAGSRDVGAGAKLLRRRLSAALSHVDFEHCDPPTCVSVLSVASIQVTTTTLDPPTCVSVLSVVSIQVN